MLLNRIKKLIVVTLCALFVLPLINVNLVSAADYDHQSTAYVGLSYVYKISKDDIKNAKIDDITISAKKESDADYVDIFVNSEDVATDNYKVSFVTGNVSTDAKVTVMVREVGIVDIKVSVADKTTTHVARLNVKKAASEEELAPKYVNLDSENETFKEYLKSVASNTKKNGAQILAGDDYTIPKLEGLVESVVPYDSLKKTLYYSIPNSTSYSSKTFTKADGTFTISNYGTYRFYVTLYVEKFDKFEDGILLGTENLEEKVDGFYQIKDAEGNNLYAKKVNNSWKYYVDKEYETEYDGATQEEMIIPIFSFTLDNVGPSIKITTTYQENGYVDLEYNLANVTVNGTDVQTEYKLQYRAKGATQWVDAEEEFDQESLSFTPTKIGSYRVIITATDATNITATKESLEIVVEEKYKPVTYQVSFADWISVNLVPFIFLCISGACLIAIILLLVIKPKE